MNRDFHCSREAQFSKIIFCEMRIKCLIRCEPNFHVFVIFDNCYYIDGHTWHFEWKIRAKATSWMAHKSKKEKKKRYKKKDRKPTKHHKRIQLCLKIVFWQYMLKWKNTKLKKFPLKSYDIALECLPQLVRSEYQEWKSFYFCYDQDLSLCLSSRMLGVWDPCLHYKTTSECHKLGQANLMSKLSIDK